MERETKKRTRYGVYWERGVRELEVVKTMVRLISEGRA